MNFGASSQKRQVNTERTLASLIGGIISHLYVVVVFRMFKGELHLTSTKPNPCYLGSFHDPPENKDWEKSYCRLLDFCQATCSPPFLLPSSYTFIMQTSVNCCYRLQLPYPLQRAAGSQCASAPSNLHNNTGFKKFWNRHKKKLHPIFSFSKISPYFLNLHQQNF